MKIFKTYAALVLLASTGLCHADGNVTGTITLLRLLNATSTAPRYTILKLSTISNTNTDSCASIGWRLVNMDDVFSKQAYAALSAAKNEGWTVTIDYTVQSIFLCKITSVRLLQKI